LKTQAEEAIYFIRTGNYFDTLQSSQE